MRRERGVAREADAGILTDFEDNDRRAAMRSSISGHSLSGGHGAGSGRDAD